MRSRVVFADEKVKLAFERLKSQKQRIKGYTIG